MIFETPPRIPKLPFQPPDTVPIHDFLFSEGDRYGRHPKADSKPPFTDGLTGKTYSVFEVAERFEALARALAQELGWEVNTGDEMDKVIAFFSLNTVDTLTVSWAAHRLNGVSCPISPAYTTEQVVHQLSFAGCKAIFTSAPFIDVALEAAATAGISRNHVYVLEVPPKAAKGMTPPEDLKTVDHLIQAGKNLASIPEIKWTKGQGARQTAFLCSSSGTSGLPKSVKVTHRNVIANVLQFNTLQSVNERNGPEFVLGVLPQSHAFALIGTAHMSIYRGDGIVILQSFDIHDLLQSIQQYHIGTLWMIPPFIVAMINAAIIVRKYDLSSVKNIIVGAAALTKETLAQFSELLPNRNFIQGYGLTEATCIISITDSGDVMFGSCGYLLPGIEARLIDANGKEVEEYDVPGEMQVRSPSITPGYLKNEEAMKEMLTEDGWLRTGDLIEMRKSAQGNTHLFIVDRIKELIKVNGMQVAPAELQGYLLQHPAVADVAVIPVPNKFAGELPRAYIIRSEASRDQTENAVKKELHAYIDEHFPAYKRLAGGIVFMDAFPKTASGKIQRGVLKDMAKASVEASKKAVEDIKARNIVVGVYEFDSDDDDDE